MLATQHPSAHTTYGHLVHELDAHKTVALRQLVLCAQAIESGHPGGQK